MFGGVASDCWIAVIAGGAAFLTFSLVQRFIQIKFFSEFVASAVVITIAATFTKLGIATNQNIITISSVMPLVPGILICNAIRDLMAGELLAGMSRRGSCINFIRHRCWCSHRFTNYLRKAVYKCYFIYSILQLVSFLQYSSLSSMHRSDYSQHVVL